MERETGIGPATNSLEGCDSTIELLPLTGVFNPIITSRVSLAMLIAYRPRPIRDWHGAAAKSPLPSTPCQAPLIEPKQHTQPSFCAKLRSNAISAHSPRNSRRFVR